MQQRLVAAPGAMEQGKAEGGCVPLVICAESQLHPFAPCFSNIPMCTLKQGNSREPQHFSVNWPVAV